MKYTKALHFARSLRIEQTKAEKLIWKHLRNRRFRALKFNRQFIIEHANINNERYFFIVDFYCHAKNLIIEIDGKIHALQKDYDFTRELILKEMGFRIVRFTNEEVLTDVYKVLTRLKIYLDKCTL